MIDDLVIKDLTELINNAEFEIDKEFNDLDLGDKMWIISVHILNKVEKIKVKGLEKKKIKLIKE